MAATINIPAGGVPYYGTDGADNIYGTSGDDIIYGGDGGDNLRGGAGSDRLYGGDGEDQLDGGTGADYLAGGAGNDTYVIDDNKDFIYEAAGEGIDTVKSFLANYKLSVNLENLLLQGTENINGAGNESNNTIKGNSGDNSLQGWGGDDSINGGAGNDIINGGEGNDFLDGGDGVDIATYHNAASGVTVSLATILKQNTGGAGIDSLRNIENLEGSKFNDVLTGNGGDNKISALAGDDIIRGGAGNDDLTGGTGADQFLFEAVSSNGVDFVRSFTTGIDKLVFSTAEYTDSSLFTVSGSDLSYNGTLLAHVLGSPINLVTDIVIA